MALSDNLIKKILEMKYDEEGNVKVSNRQLSRDLFGTDTRESTIRNILKRHGKPSSPENTEQKQEPRVFVFDIETSPIKAYVWGLFKQNIPINAIVDDWIVLTWAGKWLGEETIYSDSVANHNYRGHCDYDAEYYVLCSIWEKLDKADIVVAHNGIKFDKKKLNAKFLEHGLGEPSPYKIIDTLNIAKANFALTSNKLDYITKFLEGEGKMDTGGLQLWIDFLNGCPVAQQTMLEYNIQDVSELEYVYLGIRSWDKRSPNMALYYEDTEERCNKCGSDDLRPLENKYSFTNLSQFEVKQCGCCGGYVRGRVNQLSKDKRQSLNMNVL